MDIQTLDIIENDFLFIDILNIHGNNEIILNLKSLEKPANSILTVLLDQRTHTPLGFFITGLEEIKIKADLKNNTFIVISHFENFLYNAVIADNIGGADYVDG